jgi:protein TonB
MQRAAVPSLGKSIALPGLIVANDGEVLPRQSRQSPRIGPAVAAAPVPPVPPVSRTSNASARRNWFGANRTGIVLSIALHLVLMGLLGLRLADQAPPPEENFIIMDLVAQRAGQSAEPPLVRAESLPTPTAKPASSPKPQRKSAAAKKSAVSKPEPMAETQAQSPIAAPAPATSMPQGGDVQEQFPPAYLRTIARILNYRTVWPASEKRDGHRGTAIVNMQLARDGTVLAALLVRGTGYPLLDKEAVGVIRRVARFPPVPAEYRPDLQEFTIYQPVGFGPP